jgi:hypothetical protein
MIAPWVRAGAQTFSRRDPLGAATVWAALLATLLLTPGTTRACGGSPESWTLLTSDRGQVPVGTRVLKLYHYLGGDLDLATVTFTLYVQPPLAPETTVPVQARSSSSSWLIEIDLGGHAVSFMRYRLEISQRREGRTITHSLPFEALPISAAPSSLTLGPVTPEAGVVSYGGCGDASRGVQAVVALDVSLDDARPLRLAQHQLLVDGVPAFAPEMPLVDYLTRAKPLKVRAYAVCSRLPRELPTVAVVDAVDLELPPASHRVQWQTRLMDGTTLMSNELTVDLSCPGASAQTSPTATADAGATDGSAAEDAGAAEASAPASTPMHSEQAGATTTADVEASGPPPEQTMEPADSSAPPASAYGCALSPLQADAGDACLYVLALLGGIVARRRRHAVRTRA